jgi:hypothetical protein
MKIRNTKPEFGDCGPFEADSFEALADEMTERFLLWADEVFDECNDPDLGIDVDRDAWVDGYTARLRDDFIRGLEEV